MRTLAIGLSVLVVSAGALAFALGGGGGSEPVDPPPPPANTAFARVLLRLGLGADTLAAAGVSSQQATALVTAVEGAHAPATLASRDEAFIAAKQACDRLRRTVQGGRGSQEDVTALRTAETTLADATASRDAYLASLRSSGLATLSEGQSTLVERIRANRIWALPTQYLVKDRSEPDWVRLRDSLASKRISEEDEEEEFAASAQSHLAAVDAEAEVAAAKVNLDSNLAAVQIAWNLAVVD